MRTLSRALSLAALAAAATAPSAAAAPTLSAGLSPNKGGSLTVAAPTTFKIGLTGAATPYDNSGQTRLKAIKANLPEQLLFNSIGFKQCSASTFIATKTCPAATKLGEADILVNAGPDFPETIPAKATLYFGSGFTVLAHVTAEQPAVIDQAVVGELRSSGATGYGLQIYIPVPAEVSVPIDRVYPVMRSVSTTVTPPTRSVKVPGETKKVKLPLAGLGPCSGALNFSFSVVYMNDAGTTEKVETATSKASCKK